MSSTPPLFPELLIRVSGGSGHGRTSLSAFDAALADAGVANFNLVRLSSVIPPAARVETVGAGEQIRGGHGDLLHCVYAEAHADVPGETAWAGIGWSLHEDGSRAGLFVEHHAHTRTMLSQLIQHSLGDLSAVRGGSYHPAGEVFSSVTCRTGHACAVVVASYRSNGWAG